MIYDYFSHTSLDKNFYEERLKNRLPHNLIDSHTHINLPEHVASIPEERICSDWALQSGFQMTAEDAAYYYSLFFPGKQVSLVSFPFPIKEASMEANNAYVASCAMTEKIAYGLMCIKPNYSCEYIEKEVIEKGFSGLKPYPDMVTGLKGADISIFDFFPHKQIALAEKMHLPVVMHLPRAGRMPDMANIRELREIRQMYPELTIIIAHFGRCYTPYHFQLALDRLGTDTESFYFDTAAVLNPDVIRVGFDRISPQKILYGTDEPIFLWHGYRKWTKTQYINIAREDFLWNTNRQDKNIENTYTFFIYRQLDNILNELERFNASSTIKNAIFRNNCLRIYDKK